MSPASRWPLAYCTLDRSPLFGQPETLVEQITAAGVAGFTRASVDMFALRAFVEAGKDLAALAGTCADAGVAAFDIAGVNISADREASLGETLEMARYANALGAAWLQARITAPLEDDAALETYRECAALAASHGVGFGLEFSPFTPINSLGYARVVLDEVRDAAPRQGIIVDTWHLTYGDGVAALLALPAADLAFVQFEDAAAGSGRAMRDTLNHRALPGEGTFDLGAFVDALVTIGFTGVLSVEVLSDDLRTLPLDEYVRRCHDATVAVVSR
jgi:sugar phosphate isomerase/epimerase